MRLFLLLLAALPTADAGVRPVLALSDVHTDACGQVLGTLEVRSKGREREIELHIDEKTHTVVVPSRTTEVPFAVPAAPGEWEMEVSASWRFVDTEPEWVERTPWDVALDVRPPPQLAQGEPEALPIRLVGTCDPAPLTLLVRLDGTTAYRGALADWPMDLAAGPHSVEVALLDRDREIAQHALTLDVGPPCVDVDGDGHEACFARDCDDGDASVHPGAEDVVGNGVDEDCDGRNGQDRDRDGYEDADVGGTDCDDHDANIHPGAKGLPDADGDGATPVKGSVDIDCDGTSDTFDAVWDCDDSNAAIPGPEAPVPTGIDEDCDGLVDEGTIVFDDDGDGLAEVDGDCNDAAADIHPGARETADCRDEDCDGVVDNGVTRSERDDSYEPNDVEAAEIPGAYWRDGWLGGKWHKSRTEIHAVTRDLDDVERYTVYAHDGDFDSFHVTVRVDQLGDDRAYEVEISSEHGRTRRGVIETGGASVGLGGKVGASDSGTYTIEVRPVRGELSFCPLDLVVSTG